MTKGRLEAFTDGVLAIIITIMVLEMKPPHTAPTLEAIRPILPVFLSYVLSFIHVGMYWSNHHHLFLAVQRISGMTLWANLHLLFWLSLIPFVTGWMGENRFSELPVVMYGVVLLMCALSWEILRKVLLRNHAPDSALATALAGRHHLKEIASLVTYVTAIVLGFFSSWIACGLYAAVAAMWLVPDRRIERALAAKAK